MCVCVCVCVWMYVIRSMGMGWISSVGCGVVCVSSSAGVEFLVAILFSNETNQLDVKVQYEVCAPI